MLIDLSRLRFDVLGLALAHRDREADPFGRLGDGIARAQRLRRRERAVDEFAEAFARIARSRTERATGEQKTCGRSE